MEEKIMGVNFTEENVTINSDVVLKGTMAIPEIQNELLPAVIIVNGSGSADRDGNMNKPPMRGDIYKNLAHFLTSLGFITLRYDKRAVGESQGNPNTSGMLDLVEDLNNNVRFLKNHPRVDKKRIILVGHSEGCILSTIANTITPVAGMVQIGGAGTNLWGPMQYQNAQVVDEIKTMKGIKGLFLRLLVKENTIKKQQEVLFNTMVNSTGDMVRIRGKKMPAKWFREHFKISSEEIMNKLMKAECKILAVTGDKDVQANSGDLKKIEALNKDNIKCVVIENMDHMMKVFTGEKTVLGLMKQYKNEVSQPMHPELEKVLRDWLTSF